MRSVAALFLICASVAACSAPQREEVTRDAARSVVSRVILDRYPDRPVQPLLDCIISNASPLELRGLASDALTGPTQVTAVTVDTIATRGCLGPGEAGRI